jgi:hypothetical protein
MLYAPCHLLPWIFPSLLLLPHVPGEQASQGLNLQARLDEGRNVPSALLSTLIWVGTEVCAFPRPWQMELDPFVSIPTQPLLAVVDVIRCHYRCPLTSAYSPTS